MHFTFFSQDGRWLATSLERGETLLWDLEGPPGSIRSCCVIGRGHRTIYTQFDPSGAGWPLGEPGFVSFWPLAGPTPRVLRAHSGAVTGLTFAPDGKSLFSTGDRSELRQWPLTPGERARQPH